MATTAMIDPAIFQSLQQKIDADTTFRDKIRDISQLLEKQVKSTQAILSRIHGTSPSSLPALLETAGVSIKQEGAIIADLSVVASTQPYYKWNNMWNRTVQDTIYTVLLFVWLGGGVDGTAAQGRLLTLEEVGSALGVPTNLKDRDAFHITIEEYLLALVSLIDELARLARTSVTLGDYGMPLRIASFIKDVHAGFQVLNLKNDVLRKRSDGVKYRVREVEDVVYDLSLRGLVPKEGNAV